MITEYRIRLVFCLQCMLENINLLIFYSFSNFRDCDKNTQLCSVSIKMRKHSCQGAWSQHGASS